MRIIGDILWLVFGSGITLGISWLLIGCFWCITIIGIPIGIACFRIARFAFLPFSQELVSADEVGEKAVPGSLIMNIIWCIFCGFWLALIHWGLGIVCCTTIIGIPFGMAHFKIGLVAFAPLGKRVIFID